MKRWAFYSKFSTHRPSLNDATPLLARRPATVARAAREPGRAHDQPPRCRVESSETVHREIARLPSEGMFHLGSDPAPRVSSHTQATVLGHTSRAGRMWRSTAIPCRLRFVRRSQEPFCAGGCLAEVTGSAYNWSRSWSDRERCGTTVAETMPGFTATRNSTATRSAWRS